jgi:protein-S-isoprenylcysteine O-methyltransferase Ste14
VGGVRALAAHPRALALLAVWGMGALVLGALRPVRVHDPVAVRPDRLAMVLLLLIPLVTPAVSAWGERMGFWLLPGGAALRWGGVTLAAAGLALRIAAITQLGSRFSPLVSVQREHALATSGVYARIRHPGYLGAWLAAVGGALAFGSAVGLPLVALFWLLLAARAGREEALLEAHFGEAYRAYRARSGGLLPRP